MCHHSTTIRIPTTRDECARCVHRGVGYASCVTQHSVGGGCGHQGYLASVVFEEFLNLEYLYILCITSTPLVRPTYVDRHTNPGCKQPNWLLKPPNKTLEITQPEPLI